MVHPKPTVRPRSATVAFVVPVHADDEGLARLLPALRAGFPDERVIVVDDASPEPATMEALSRQHGVEFMRRPINGGPGAARNTGWRALVSAERAAVDIVVFIDADVEPCPGSIELLLAHFDDDVVAAVAPRVCADDGDGALDRYEACSSPLDMGSAPALVQPRSRVSYVPSATLAVRMPALASSEGFDEAMRIGEDVDLVWRLGRAGGVVRYAPDALVRHRNRPDISALARQRFMYGTSAAELAARHGDAVAPAELDLPTLATWVAMVFGGPRSRLFAIAAGAAASVPLARKLHGKLPSSELARLVALGQLASVNGLANALTRAWFPLALPTRRGRRALAIALVLRALTRWTKDRPALDPASFVAWSALDDLSYCAGVWTGACRRRSAAALVPRVRSFSR